MKDKCRPKQVGYVNPANMLTLLRVPLALLGIFAYQTVSPLAGVVLIALASLTDMFDGLIARRFNYVSEFGALFDRTVDKSMMVLVVFFAFFETRDISQILLFGIGVVEVLNFGVAIYYLYFSGKQRSKHRVDWRGKSAMFARMASVSALLLAGATTGDSHTYLLWLGITTGVFGILFGLVAFADYVDQGRKAPNKPKID